MDNILSNFEGWGPTEIVYKKKESVVYLIYIISFSFARC